MALGLCQPAELQVALPLQPRVVHLAELLVGPHSLLYPVEPGQHLRARPRQNLSGRRDDERRRLSGQALVPGKLVDRGQVAQLHP